MKISKSDNQQASPRDENRCPYCQRRFDTADDLTLHIVTRHTQSGVNRAPAQAGGGH